MTSPNPYESPQAAPSAQPLAPAFEHPTRWRAVRSGMWRGVKLGFIVVGVIFGTLGILAMVMVILVPEIQREALRDFDEVSLSVALAKGIVCLVFGVPAVALLYGSIPGAVIMGVAAAIRWRRPSGVNKTSTLPS